MIPIANARIATPSVTPSTGVYSVYKKCPSVPGYLYRHGHQINATTNARPAIAETTNHVEINRSARFSALVPFTGQGSGYSSICTPSRLVPSLTSWSRSISASCSAVGSGWVSSPPGCSCSLSVMCLCPRSNPQGRAEQGTNTHDPRDDAFRSGSEAAQRQTATTVVTGRNRLDVGDDVFFLLLSQLPIGE